MDVVTALWMRLRWFVSARNLKQRLQVLDMLAIRLHFCGSTPLPPVVQAKSECHCADSFASNGQTCSVGSIVR